MAFRVSPKLLSTTHDTFREPHYDQYDFKYYHPQLFTHTRNHYRPDKGTRKFFHDYRRSHIVEQTLKKNLESFGGDAEPEKLVRPTWNSDKPDRVLGRRKIDRESLFPVIQNKPVYTLSNGIPDRERDRDGKFRNETEYHRTQYRDLTGSIHKKSPYFHVPDAASSIFAPKDAVQSFTDSYPSHQIVAGEMTYDLERAPSLMDLTKTDVF